MTSPTDEERLKTKIEITSEMGITSQQVSQYQQIAQNPGGTGGNLEFNPRYPITIRHDLFSHPLQLWRID